jgi:NADH-quinone oxidoreductase subunit G
VRERLDRARKPLMLVSPDLSLEQMWAVKRIATLYGAELSGYSDSYVIDGDGDDYLINDDKAANRKGLELLDIDSSKEQFVDTLQYTDLLVNFNNDLFYGGVDEELKAQLDKTQSIAVCSHQLPVFESATIVLPTASYSEYGGTILNEDYVLQRFEKALFKNEDPRDVLEITRLLGGAIIDAPHAWPGIRQSVARLANIDPETIPTEGLNLQNSEDTNVGA